MLPSTQQLKDIVLAMALLTLLLFCSSLTAQEGTFQSGYKNPNPFPDMRVYAVSREQANKASRFLNQATLGANYATITQVAKMGEEQWLQQQFASKESPITPYATALITAGEKIYQQHEDSLGEEGAIERVMEHIGDPERLYINAWWTQAVTAPDTLRHRIATALSEIFVVSNRVEEIGTMTYPISHFYDTLLTHSFGNYRDLLKAVTLHPAMGVYLSHLNNAKADPAKGTFPDENYAREVMQLFSIGLFELNPDGSLKKDQAGQAIATYDNADIREFAKIFTGLSYGGEDAHFGNQEPGNDVYLVPMQMFNPHHQQGQKKLLNGMVVPAGQTGMQDIDSAIDNLFNHPNVGPFFGRLLIQRLVTSNPSPAYINRVTQAFNGGNGKPRGDMQNLIRAILLDPEARSLSGNENFGRLREPMLRIVHLTRAFNAQTFDRTFNDNGFELEGMLQQSIFASPSVFNFFQPGYAPNGIIKESGLVAPEFQITNSSTILGVKNYLYDVLLTGTPLTPVGKLPVATLQLTQEQKLASNTEQLLDRLDTVLTYGTLTPASRQAIKTALAGLNSPREKVLMAIYLIMISPDYAVAI